MKRFKITSGDGTDIRTNRPDLALYAVEGQPTVTDLKRKQPLSAEAIADARSACDDILNKLWADNDVVRTDAARQLAEAKAALRAAKAVYRAAEKAIRKSAWQQMDVQQKEADRARRNVWRRKADEA